LCIDADLLPLIFKCRPVSAIDLAENHLGSEL